MGEGDREEHMMGGLRRRGKTHGGGGLRRLDEGGGGRAGHHPVRGMRQCEVMSLGGGGARCRVTMVSIYGVPPHPLHSGSAIFISPINTFYTFLFSEFYWCRNYGKVQVRHNPRLTHPPCSVLGVGQE